MPPRPQIQKSDTCTLYVLLLPVCLPTCTHPPTFASPNAAFATSAPSVGSAKSPHGCLCHLTPIHSQVVMRLVLRRLVVKDGLVWSRRVLVRWSGCDAWRRRRSTIVILVGGHLHFFFFLFSSLLGVGLVKRWPFLYLQGTRYVLTYWLEVRTTCTYLPIAGMMVPDRRGLERLERKKKRKHESRHDNGFNATSLQQRRSDQL